MEDILSKKELKEYMAWEGEGRGYTIKLETNYIRRKEGEEGVKKIEEAMTKVGYPVKYSEVKALQFYPIGVEVLTLLAIKRIFNYGNEEFYDIGASSVKDPLISRGLFISKSLLSLERIQMAAPGVWDKYYLIGSLSIPEYNKEEKWAVVRFANFHHHPLNWEIVRGGVITVFELIYGKKIVCEQTKSIFRGDDCHELIMKW